MARRQRAPAVQQKPGHCRRASPSFGLVGCSTNIQPPSEALPQALRGYATSDKSAMHMSRNAQMRRCRLPAGLMRSRPLLGSRDPAAWPLAARAQQPERMRRVGVLMGFSEDDPDTKARLAKFRQGLETLGWSRAAMSASTIASHPRRLL